MTWLLFLFINVFTINFIIIIYYIMNGPPAGYLYDCSCIGHVLYGCSQCKLTCDASGSYSAINQKRMWNTVRVQESEYTMNLGALTVYQKPRPIYANVNWNQYSDRALPAHSIKHNLSSVPTHGSSTKFSITRLRPGSLKPLARGVDIKHGSYDRYLARIKGKGPLRTQRKGAPRPVWGDKTKAYGIVGAYDNVGSCLCFS
jgi:hypothetical protein